MKKTHIHQGLLSALGMFFFILDSKTAVEGARSGIALCLKTVIPSLFPFFIFSFLTVDSFLGADFPLSKQLRQIVRIPKGCESILICGFLGGYPTGAQCISAAHRTGQLSSEAAAKLLAFCNNAGPAFLFGMLSAVFPFRGTPWILWLIHIASALLVAQLLPVDQNSAIHIPKKSASLSTALHTALRCIASVCGWVILFRTILAFFQRWFFWILPAELQVLFTGILELSNACCLLPLIDDLKLRFLICSGMLSFGGLCVTMQTFSVANGISLRYYLPGKILQTLFSFMLSYCFLYHNGLLCLILFPILFILFRGIQKKSSFQQVFGI